jgi:chromosome segregation ATPase
MQVIAKEEVEVERLQKEIATAEGRVDKEKQDVMRLKNDIASPRESYEYAGRKYTIKQVKLDLANRFERLKTNDATLASLRDIHQARTKGLEAARAKLEGMLAAKRQLEVDVENLEARLKMVEVAQTASSLSVDESKLGRTKELVAELRSRLQVAEKIVGAEGQYKGEIPLEDPAAADIVEQVTEYFHDGAAQPVVASNAK